MKADTDRLVAGMHVSGGPDKVEREIDTEVGVGVTDENTVDTDVDVERTDKDVEVQTGGLAVDVEREEPADEGESEAPDEGGESGGPA